MPNMVGSNVSKKWRKMQESGTQARQNLASKGKDISYSYTDKPAYEPRFSYRKQGDNTLKPITYNYNSTPANQWTAPQYAAYGQHTGDTSVFDQLSTETDIRGSQFWNPYRGGRNTLPSGVAEFFKTNYGYEGPFDQKFLDDFAFLANSVGYTNTNAIKTPTKKSSVEEWGGYYHNLIAKNMKENQDTNDQFADYRSALKQYADDYQRLHGHAPSLEEFVNSVDRSKYSKLTAIDDTFNNFEKTVQILPTGTFYSPDIIPGLYSAWLNGDDITADRDYFSDSVNYWMNPVQSSPSNKQYAWSGTDLSGLSADDRANYTKQLKSAGNFEEAAAFDFALWAADQQAKGVEVNPTILQQTVGYYKDDNWFNTAHELLGDEYEKRMTYDPSTGLKTMDSKYGRDTASDMDRACYELYKAEQLRADTDEAESEWNNVKSQIKSIFSNFTYESEEQFRQDVYDLIDIENNTVLKNYMNPDKAGNYCRRMPIDQDNLDAMIHRVWRGGSIDENVDYTAMDDEWEAPFVHEQAMETPPLYKETQRILADQHAINRDNAERQAVEAVVSLADSGAPVSKGELPVASASYGEDDGEEITLSGKLAALWRSVRIGSYQAKLGDEFDNQAIAAIDPVMNQLDLEHAPQDVFVTDVKQLAEAHTLARVNDEDITLATGIIGYALPGAKFLADSIINASIVPSNSFVRNVLESKFNVGVYKSIFEDRVAAGLSEEDAADVAFFAATDLNASMESVGTLYEGDKDLKVASDALISSIAAEDGAKDSYEIIKGINDDVYKLKRENFEGIVPDVDLTDFNTALVIGSSEKASPAFRAETNKLLHDIASGYITPEDIVEGLVGGTHVELPSGAKLLREDYNKAVEQAKAASESRGFFGGGYNYEDMPEELSAAINRDYIMAMAEEAANSAELADIAQQMGAENLRDNIAEDFMDAAIDDLVNPDAAYHTNSQMETLGSDFLGGLEAVTGGTDAAGVEANKANAERTALQAYREDDPYNLLPALMAVHGEAESDMGDLVDFFRSYGIWFSRNEVNSAFNAFVNGTASLNDIVNLGMERVASVPKELVNGYQNTDMLASSISTMRASLDDLAAPSGLAIDQQLSRSLMEGRTIDSIIEEYPEAFEGADKIALQDRANAIISSGGDDVEERLNTLLKKYTGNIGADKYTPEQIEMAGKLVDWVESLGPEAVMFTYADNDLIKELSGGTVDLDAAGFDKSFADIMKDLDPKWMDAYTTNVGSDVPLYGPLAGVASGIESVASTAAYLDHFFAKDHKGILDESYQAFKNVEGDVESYGQNVATAEQEMARQVVSDVTRNVLNSMIGGKLSEWFLGSATQFFANGGTIAEKIAGISGYENIVGVVAKVLQRGPFGLGVFAHEADEELSKGSSDAKAAIRGLFSAGIEFLTESPIIDKATTARIGGMSLVEHAARGINSVPGLIRYHIINTAQNVVTEITQEELSEFFDRLVDVGDDFLHGKSIGESWDSAFSGYGEAVKATAVSTALSTLLFGLIDAGALSMNVIQTGRDYRNSTSEREEQRRIEADRLLRELEVAYYASLDDDQSTIDSELENDDVATPSSESTTPVDTEVGSEDTSENDDVALGKTEKTTESVDKAVEAAEKRVEEAAKEAAKEALSYEVYDIYKDDIDPYPDDMLPSGEFSFDYAIESYYADAKKLFEDKGFEEQDAFEKRARAAEDNIHALYEKWALARTSENRAAFEKARDSYYSTIVGEEAAKEAKPEAKGIDVNSWADPELAVSEEAYQDLEDTEYEKARKEVEEAAKEAKPEAKPKPKKAKAKKTSKSVAKFTEAAKELNALRDEQKAMRQRDEEQKAAEEPERTMSTPAAQDVANFVAASKPEIDKAIVNAGAEEAGKRAVAEDPGLKAKQDAINKKVQAIAQQEQKIQELNQQSEHISNQMRQAFRAAADEGIDPTTPNPQTTNTTFAKQQEKAAADEEASKTAEKTEQDKKFVDTEQQLLDEEVEKIRQQAIEQSEADLLQKQEEYKAQAAELEDEKQRAVNTERAEARGERVLQRYTNEEYDANAQMRSLDSHGRYFGMNADTSFEELTEESTDPSTHVSPLVEQRREDEWKEEAAANKTEIQDEEDYQRRLMADYRAGIASQRGEDENRIPVSKDVYNKVVDAMKKRIGVVDTSQAFSRIDNGGVAPVSESTEYNDAIQSKDSAVYSAATILNDDGSVTGGNAAIIYDAVTDPDAATKTNPGDSFEHVTENNRFLILKPVQEKTDAYSQTQRYEYLTNVQSEDGLTGIERLERKLDSAENMYGIVQSKLNDAILDLLKANNAFDRGFDETGVVSKKDASRRVQQAKKAVDAATRKLSGYERDYAKAVKDLDDANEFLRTYVEQDSQSVQYILIDKSKLPSDATAEHIAVKALAIASAQFSEYSKLSDEGFATLLEDVGYNRSALDRMDASELPLVYMDYLYDKATSDLSRKAFKGAVSTVTDEPSVASSIVNRFVNEHGGYAEDGFGGKGFASFTEREYYNPDTLYFISEGAAHQYLSEDEVKSIGVRRTAAQYNAAVNGDIDAYAKENNLSDEDMRYLRQQFTVQKPTNSRKAFYRPTSDSTHDLGIRELDRNNPDVNSYIRDENGNYDTGMAKMRLHEKMSYIMEHIDDPNFKLDQHSVRIDYVDGYGKPRSKIFGETYSDDGEVSRWFPPYSWIINNATEITCNFFCDSGFNNGDSKVNYKLYPISEKSTLPDYDQQYDQNAWLRSESELKDELAKFAEWVDKYAGADPKTKDAFFNAYYAARQNYAQNQYAKYVKLASNADSIDKLRTYAAEAEAARFELEYWQKSSITHSRKQKKTDDSLVVNGNGKVSIPDTAQGRYERAKTRLEQLNDENGPYYKIPKYDHERKVLSDVIDVLKQYADEEAAKQTNRPSPAPAKGPESTIPAAIDKVVTDKWIKEMGYDTNPYEEKAITPETPEEKKIVEELKSLAYERADILESMYEKDQEAMASHEDANYGDLSDKLKAIEEKQDALTKKFQQLREARKPASTNTEEKSKAIDSFRGDNSFLSNFFEAPIEIDGITYKNAEAAFQAQKLENPEDRQQFADLSGKDAKRLGRRVQLRDGWNDMRLDAMRTVVEAKFSQNPELMEKLLATGNADLIEGNTWNDTFWGVSKGSGENNLGKILMAIRDQNTQASAPSIQDLDPLMRISVMRNLRNMGENVDAELSKAIAAYHEDQTKDMSLDEKLDYYAALAQRAKTHPDSPLVDQSANYEAQLMDMLDQKEIMEQSKLGQRLKYITKKAGNMSYKSLGKLNSILKELDDAQKRGFAVDNARALVQQNIDAINGRVNPVKDAAKESAISSIAGDDRAAKVDLGLFGEDTTESASASIMEEMGEFVTPETMDAAAGEAAEAMLTSMAEETEPAPLETGFESLVEAMSEFDGARIAGLPLNEIVNTLAYQRQRIADLTEERDSLTASIDKMKGEKTKHRELQATLEPMAATFTDEQRKAYNDAAAAIRRIDREVNEKIITRKDLKDRIAELRNGMEYYGTALANHTLSQGILNNKAAMSPELLAGKARHGEFVRDRSALKKLARDFVGGLNYEYGRNTTFTPQELFTEFVKHVDAETLANDREVALAVNSGLKARKEAIELLKLGKYVLDNMTGKLNDDAFKTHVSKTIDNIVGLTRETGFTNADIRNRQRLRDRVTRNVTSWIDRVHNDMVSGSNIDNVYSLLDHQMLTLSNNIDQTEKFVSNYFRISAADLMGSFTGSAGGRDPISKVRLGVGLVMNSIGNSDFHPASLTFDNIQRVVTNFLNGKEGAVFNAMYLMPLMQSNGEIAKDKKSILQSLPKIESLEHREIVTEMIDQGIFSEDSLREAHPELSHVEAGNLIDWANAYRDVFKQLNARQNVVYSRNGLDPVKRRNDYVPYIKKEQNKWLREMGFNTTPDNLSAGLFGNTSDTTPPHRFNPFEKERDGEGMEGLETDINKLMNQYLDFVLPTIYRTDATIRLNDIIDALGGFTDKSSDGEEYRRGAVDFADSGELNTKNFETFVKALKVYRDMMTNKKVGYLDRAVETKCTRRVFGVLKGLTAMQGAAKVGGNMRPVILNSIPLAETFAMMPKDVAVAIAQTLDRSTDDISDDSNFAASRLSDKDRGDGLYAAVTKILFMPMEKSDAFVTEIVWRAMYNNCYNKTHDEEKSKLQADKFCLDVMADKSTGNRGQLYASAVGGMLGQFTQEGVNNISFLMRDMLPYLGIDKKTTGYSSGVRGAVKALTAIILMMLQNRVINEVVGGNAAIDPLGSYMKAKGTAKAKDEDATFLDVMKEFGDNMLQTLNPIDSITGGNLSDTPVPSAIKNTWKNTKSGVLGFANFWNALFNDDPETKLDFGWAENFADILLEWAPGGTEMKRIKNTAQTAYKGYVESTSKNSLGNIKYQVQNNLFDLGMSSVFGTGASKEGREYSYGKIKQMTSNESDEVKRLVDNGVSPSDAIRQVRGTTATKASDKEANEAAKFGEDSSKMEADAKASREQLDFPSDASDYAIQNLDSEWMQKGIQMYKETGLITYPKGLGSSVYETERNGEKVRYLKANNKNYPITPEQEEQMIATYNRQAQQIIMMNDDPKVIADKLSKLPASVKKSVLGGN